LLALFARRPWRIPAYGRLMAALHAQMHACRVPELPTQRSMFERRSQNEPAIPDDLRLAARESLATLPDGDALCHGDFHPDNIILSLHGPVILDWMTASRGCPAADVARTLLLIRIGEPVYPLNPVMIFLLNRARNVFVGAYLKEYRRLTGTPQADIDAWRFVTAVARLVEQIPSEREKLLAICRP
jgi:aminoglycoside phosphotransferase (APT) family kinase protein